MSRKILHLDLDAFFCSVEEILHPELRNKAFVVGGKPDQRGVVASCSYAARQFGIRSAMPTAKALALCPKLTIVKGTHGAYGEYSSKVMSILDDTTPLVQQISVDEAFLDVSDMPQSGKQIAKDLQERVMKEVALPCSIGVATNKLLAKIANDFGKSLKKSAEPPMAITVVPPGGEAAFLAPLPVQALWGIGPKSASHLHDLGINLIGELANLSDQKLKQLFGVMGQEIKNRARGIDESPIRHEHEIKSISNEVTFSKDISQRDELLKTLMSLSDKVGSRLRGSLLAGNIVHLKLRYSDFSTITRRITLPNLTNLDNEIFRTAVTLLDDNWTKLRPVRLLGVGVSGLGSPVRQMELWSNHHIKEQKLLEAVDNLKQKYGKDIITRATKLQNSNK